MGSTVTWSVTVSNGGNTPTGAIKVTVSTDDPEHGVVSSAPVECDAPGITTECDVAPLGPGASQVLTFATTLASGEYDFVHRIQIDEFGGERLNSSVQFFTYDPANLPDARVTNLSVTPVAGEPDVFDVTWRVYNVGGRASISLAFDLTREGERHISVSQLAPPGALNCTLQQSGSHIALFCDTRTYAAGEVIDVAQRLQTGSDRRVGTQLYAQVTGPVPDRDTSNNGSLVNVDMGGGNSGPVAPPGGPVGGGTSAAAGPTDVAVALTASRVRAASGDRVSLRAEVRRSLFIPAASDGFLLLIVELPRTMTLESTTYDSGAGCSGTTIIQCDAGRLSKPSHYVVEFVVRVTSSAESVISAQVVTWPRGIDPNPSDNTATLRLNTPSGITRSGTAGANTLRGTPYRDRLYGRGGRDTIYGLAGNDLLVGGAQVDSISGGAGDDVIRARDGERDTVICGAGRDTVIADPVDRIARDCEAVARG